MTPFLANTKGKKVKRLNICFFSPYIPKHFGGGERHVLSIASYLSTVHNVSIAVASEVPISEHEAQMVRQAYQSFFQLDLSEVSVISTPIYTQASTLTKTLWTRHWDILYVVSDGSIFYSLANKNLLHVQVPFPEPLEGTLNRFKLSAWEINTNSLFTRDVIERRWKTKVKHVHYPSVDLTVFTPNERKEKIILNVGRFIQSLNTKHQDVLVKMFKKLCDRYPKQMNGWKLVLAGSVEEKDFARKVSQMAEGYPIEIYHNLEFSELKKLYARAKLYWHAAGYQQDEFLHPENVEHFGISTLEAMACGCIPIVMNKGGLKEIIEHSVNGFVWNDIDGLIEKTLACIEEVVDLKQISLKARTRAADFSLEKFFQSTNEVFGLGEQLLTDVKPHNKNISTIIPNYNGQKLLAKNLQAVIEAMDHQDELIIVDDASTDTSVEWLRQKFGLKKTPNAPDFLYSQYEGKQIHQKKRISVKLLQNAQNERFAESCNRGVKVATNDFVFILNSDVKPRVNCLDILRRHFLEKRNTHLFGVNPLEIEKDERGKEVKGGKNKLWFERGLFVHSRADEYTTGRTAWGAGGSCLFDRNKWLELNGFDLRYKPAYWEDIDLSYRAKKRGWFVLFDESAIVEHRHETTNQTVFGTKKIEIMSLKNAILFTLSNGNLWQKVQFFLWQPYHLTFTNIRTSGSYARAFGGVVYDLVVE